MLAWIVAVIFYLLAGFLMWILGSSMSTGSNKKFGVEDFLFIAFWLPAVIWEILFKRE